MDPALRCAILLFLKDHRNHLHLHNIQNLIFKTCGCKGSTKASTGTIQSGGSAIVDDRIDRKQKRVKMSDDDVHEVRYCLKSLRDQMAARHNHNNNNKKIPNSGLNVDMLVRKTNGLTNGTHFTRQGQEDDESIRELKEANKNLQAQIKEMEESHKYETERLKEEIRDWQRRYAEDRINDLDRINLKKQKIDMQKLIEDLKLENTTLQEKLTANEAELQKLGGLKKTDSEDESEQLKKDLATLKKKNHNLDDMLKSQQKKIRNMIEQVQNSRTIMDQRDREIGDLRERVAFLEAENREMRDRLEFNLGNKMPSKVVYSKPLTPTSPGNKSLPFIKVVELKS